MVTVPAGRGEGDVVEQVVDEALEDAYVVVSPRDILVDAVQHLDDFSDVTLAWRDDSDVTLALRDDSDVTLTSRDD